MADRALRSSIAGSPAAVGALGNLRRRAQGVTGMGLRPGRSWAVARFSLDTAMLLTAGVAATLGSSAVHVPAPSAFWLAVFAALVLVFCGMRGMYGSRLHYELLEDLRVVLIATSLAAMAVLSLRALISAPPDLSAQVIRTWAFATAYVVAGRIALQWSRAQSYRHGESVRPTLIIGAGKIGRLAAKRLLAHPELGLKPIGFLDKDPMAAEDDSLPLPVLGASWDLDRVTTQYKVEQVIVTFSRAPHEVMLRLVRRCEELGLQVAFVPRLFETVTNKLRVEHLGGLPLISARPVNPKGLQFATKYAADRLVAAVVLLIALPVMLPTAIAVLLSLGRPLFFRQVRVGRDGRTFAMLKFRTMRPATEDELEAQSLELPPDTAPGGVEGGDRRTRLGTFLRRASIDELPQLINVLKGEMSLIGPRPERPEFVGLFEQSVYRYSDRQRVKSGITGWAQVHGLRGKTSLSDRVEWDNYYIANWSLWLDLKVLLLTVLAVAHSPRHVE
ncbi:MAG: exopolysaccharide biosynthesis polyprenyl glycosylphosphotransferase [Actinomycetota bacterium]